MKLDMKETVQVPNEVTVTNVKGLVTVKGPKGEVAKMMKDPTVSITIKDSTVEISSKKGTKRQKRMLYTFLAHPNTMVKGVQEPYQYKLKICSGHFPMNVSIQGDIMSVKNFLGEKSPRTIKLKKGATVKIDGDQILVESPSKELAGQQASDIELLTAKSNRDLRIFQDGIYLIEKAGQKISEL